MTHSLVPVCLSSLVAGLLLLGTPARAQEAIVEGAAQAPAADALGPVADAPGDATDPDNCLLCHGFPGLSRLDPDSGELRLFFVSERFHADVDGPHANLACTGCHAREAVEKVPHDDVGAVDCAQACHLVTGSGSVIDFSHEGPAKSLEKSVHATEALADQGSVAPLLREGQSACLFCHDDPSYRRPAVADTFHRGVDPTVRCQTCHDDTFPVDTAHFVRHVGSRFGDQRPAAEAARACAVCHSDETFIAQNETHDAVNSFMRSFHGKASVLGSLAAPVCTDCHSSEDRDPHLILASTDAASPTHASNRHLTCRSVGCHDNAAPDLSGAGVHMRVDPAARTVEYYVTAAFVILTVGTMTLYFALLVLELANMVLRREDDEQLRLVALAKAVQAHPQGRKRLSRLTVHQRFQHWALVLAFLTLVVTGLPMKFSNVEWMPHLVALLGGLETARNVHRLAAVVISVAFVYHIGYLAVLGWKDLQRRRRERPERGLVKHLALMVWDFPMMIHPADIRDFAFLFLYLLGLRRQRPAQGRFHFSQKFEYWAVFWGMTMIGVSGAMLWVEDRAAQTFGGRALNFAYIVHSDEAFLALLYIAVVHFFAVVFSPAVFPINLGSLTGDMPPTELAENHMGHLRAVAAELGVEAPPVEHPHGLLETARDLGRRSYALVLAVLVSGFATVSISFLLHEMTGGHRAIEVEAVPLKLEASLLTAPVDEDGEVGPGAAVRNALQRGPLAHFHAIPTWYEPDPGNSCTTGGCHSSLPHGERKEVRAFLNMHTTFVDCQTCHRDQDLHGVELSWLSLDDRSSRAPPAVLRLAAMLEPGPDGASTPAGWDEALVATLREAVAESGADPELKRWLLRIESSRLGGPRYQAVVENMRARISRHRHGEYGAKIGIVDPGRRWNPDAEQVAAMEHVRGNGADLRVDERKALVTTIHRDLKKPEVECLLCHTHEDGLLDYARLGYSRRRSDALRSNTIAKQSQAVEAGETFFLPSVLGGMAAPASALPVVPAGLVGGAGTTTPATEVQP